MSDVEPSEVYDALMAADWNTVGVSIGMMRVVIGQVCPLCGSLVAEGQPSDSAMPYREQHARDHQFTARVVMKEMDEDD